MEISRETATLTEALASRGLTHTSEPLNLPQGARRGLYAHAVYRGAELVFMGTAQETWGFLGELDRAAAGELLEVEPILTGAAGVPFDRPVPPAVDAPLSVRIAHLHATHDYNDAVADCANRAVARGLRGAL